MINEIKSTVAALISLTSAFVGTMMDKITSYFNLPEFLFLPNLGKFFVIGVDVFLQRITWTIGIIAGLFSIINGYKEWRRNKEKG